jgi:SAM-dependent methyltransferase
MSATPRSIAPPAGAAPYDAIATQYQRTRGSPLRRYVEQYSFMRMLGDVRDRAVLDLACGDGCYTREIARRGAHRVLGVDISARMIQLAREQGSPEQAGIDYLVCDVQHLRDLGPFDVVSAAYLLHYARDRAELARMCRSIARQLPPGGRFVTLNENPDQPAERYGGYLRYGFSKSVVPPRVEGSPISYAMVSGRELFRFEAYHYERRTYEQALIGAGFSDIQWCALELDPQGAAAHGSDWFAEYLGNPPVTGLTCVRRG